MNDESGEEDKDVSVRIWIYWSWRYGAPLANADFARSAFGYVARPVRCLGDLAEVARVEYHPQLLNFPT